MNSKVKFCGYISSGIMQWGCALYRIPLDGLLEMEALLVQKVVEHWVEDGLVNSGFGEMYQSVVLLEMTGSLYSKTNNTVMIMFIKLKLKWALNRILPMHIQKNL